MRHKRPYAHTAKPGARWQQAAVRPVLTTRTLISVGCQFPVRAERCCVDVHASLAVSTLTVITSKYPYRSALDAI